MTGTCCEQQGLIPPQEEDEEETQSPCCEGMGMKVLKLLFRLESGAEPDTAEMGQGYQMHTARSRVY